MFGSKRHMLLDIFSNYEMPFYKFGDIIFLDKILQAVAYGEKNFSSREVLTKYQLGTSANIKNLKKAMQDKDLIDVMPDAITLQDSVFAYWLKEKY